VTEVDTTLDKLEQEKEKIWDALIKSKWGTPECKQLEQDYVSICRKIRYATMRQP